MKKTDGFNRDVANGIIARATAAMEFVDRRYLTLLDYDRLIADLLAEARIPETRSVDVVYAEFHNNPTRTDKDYDDLMTLGAELDLALEIRNLQARLSKIRRGR